MKGINILLMEDNGACIELTAKGLKKGTQSKGIEQNQK